MNGLLCTAMFEMGRLESDLRMRDELAADELARVAERLGEARSDGDAELALASLQRLAERVRIFHGDARLLDVYSELALTTVA